MHPGCRAACGSSRGQAGVRSMDILSILELARIVRATLRAFPSCPRRGKRGSKIKGQAKRSKAKAKAKAGFGAWLPLAYAPHKRAE